MKPLALLLDFDQTIVEGSTWQYIRDYLDIPFDESKLELYLQGKLDLKEWTKEDMDLILSKCENIHEVSRKILKTMKIRDGFAEFSKNYFDRFEHVGIISAGFLPILAEFAKNYKIELYGNKYSISENRVEKVERAMDGKTKYHVLQELSKAYHIIYVYDYFLKGHELEDYGERITHIKICEDNGCEKDFYGVARRVDEILNNF